MSSGSYRYRLNGEIVSVQESWTLTARACGEQRVESVRTAGDVRLEVSAAVVEGRVRACEVSWRSASVPLVAASFERSVTGISWRREIDGAVAEGLINTAVEGEVQLYPLMRIFTGPVIAALARSGGEGGVLVPNIGKPDEEQLLLPDVSLRRVICEGVDELEDHPGGNVRRWRFIGGQYDESAAFWLDDHDRLLRYEWLQSADQCWQVDLVEGSQRPLV